MFYANKKKTSPTKDGRILILSKLDNLSISELDHQEDLHKSRIKLIIKILNKDNFDLEKQKYLSIIKELDKKSSLLVKEVNKLGDENFYSIKKRYYKWKKSFFDAGFFSSTAPEALEIVYCSKDDKKGESCLIILEEMKKILKGTKNFQELINEQKEFIFDLWINEGYPVNEDLRNRFYGNGGGSNSEITGFPHEWSADKGNNKFSKFFYQSMCINYGVSENPNLKKPFELVDYKLKNIDRTFYSNQSSFMQKFQELFSNSSVHLTNCIDPKYKDFIIKEFTSNTEKYLRKIELLKRAKIKGDKKIENVGYVYVLSNEAYPNIYKIGSTYGLPEERAEELTGTGHLTPFKVVGKIKVQSAEYYEKSIHKLLKEYRVKEGREFFKLDLDKIKQCLKQVSQISDKGVKKITLAILQKEIKF